MINTLKQDIRDEISTKFETYGRIHNLKQSKELDKTIKETYDSYELSYIEVESRDAVDKIIPIVLKEINQ